MTQTGHGPRRHGLMGSTHETNARHGRHGAPGLPGPDRLRRRQRRREGRLQGDLVDRPRDPHLTVPTELPSDLPTEIPSDLPTALPTDVPTTAATGSAGGALDACTVVTPALITGTLGAASPGQGLSQGSSYGDPNAKDCYYIGGDATVVVQATTRADADMPASTTTFEGVPGAEPVPGADRGWVFASSAQGSTTAGVILVKGQHGINCSIITQGHTVTVADLQEFAQDALAGL